MYEGQYLSCYAMPYVFSHKLSMGRNSQFTGGQKELRAKAKNFKPSSLNAASRSNQVCRGCSGAHRPHTCGNRGRTLSGLTLPPGVQGIAQAFSTSRPPLDPLPMPPLPSQSPSPAAAAASASVASSSSSVSSSAPWGRIPPPR